MKLTVNKYLNVRVGAASTEAPCYEYLAPGDVIEVEDTPVTGTEIDGNSIWHIEKDTINHVWSGGFPQIPIEVDIYVTEKWSGQNITQLIDYNFLLNIDVSLKNTDGSNVVIGILDQPISTDISFKNILRPGSMLTQNPNTTTHSNFIAGLIAGPGNDVKAIKGICSSSTIIDLCYEDINGFPIKDINYYGKLIDCIKSFAPKTVIINVSRLSGDGIDFALSQLTVLTNVFFVCAAGSNDNLLNMDGSVLVGCPNSISVGTASLDFINFNASKIDPRLDVLLPIFKYVSYQAGGSSFNLSEDLSSSWGTAIVTSILGLLYSNSSLDENSSKSDIISKIINLSKSFTSSYSYLNPLKFLP